MNYFRKRYLMKKHTIYKLMTTLAILVVMGGCVKSKEQTKQAQTVASSSTQEDIEVIKQKQLAYLKEHEQEIIDFVKAQNTKVESVQIDWDETQMSDGGMFNPEYYMNVYGHINNNENSGWAVVIPLENNEKVNLSEMFIGSNISINGEPIS